MPLLRKIYKSDKEIEKRILTGLIVSDKVLSHLFPHIQSDLFELEVSKQVCKWILPYYESYKSAPKGHIKDIFEAEKSNLRKGLDEEIAQFLAKLSEEYLIEGGDETLNDDYIIQRGKDYLKERHLRKTATDINALLDIGKVKEAEELYDQRKNIIRATTYKWVKPLDDPYFVNSVFEDMDEPLFRLKGQLGNLVGDLHRGWLFAVMGPMKRGKTWDLQDVAFDSLLSRRRTAYVSMEMKDKHLAPRFYKQMTVSGDIAGDYVYPCFDCCNNQDNSCNKPIRTNRESCPPSFDPLKPGKYRSCTVCRKIETERKDYLATVWYFVAERPKLSLQDTRNSLKVFQKQFGKNLFRMISFPAFSATVEDVEDQLDQLELEEGFIPDTIITDYATIMKSTSIFKDPRHNVNEIVQHHKRLAQERNALVVTGVQSLGIGRSALTKDMQDESDIAEEARILAAVDVLMSLDQTSEEKEKGIWRMGILEHRWKKFNKRRQVMALQQLELGQPVLDTEIIYWNRRREETSDE